MSKESHLAYLLSGMAASGLHCLELVVVNLVVQLLVNNLVEELVVVNLVVVNLVVQQMQVLGSMVAGCMVDMVFLLLEHQRLPKWILNLFQCHLLLLDGQWGLSLDTHQGVCQPQTLKMTTRTNWAMGLCMLLVPCVVCVRSPGVLRVLLLPELPLAQKNLMHCHQCCLNEDHAHHGLILNCCGKAGELLLGLAECHPEEVVPEVHSAKLTVGHFVM